MLVVPAIGPNLFSMKTATQNGIVSIFDRENPRLEAFGVTLLLRGEQDDLFSFVLDLIADAYRATELAMNAVFNAQLWHLRLGPLNGRSLELMQRYDGNGIIFDGTIADCDVCAVGIFDGTIADCDVCAVGKGQELAYPKNVQHAGIPVLSSFAAATSWALSPPRLTGVSNTPARS